MHEVSLLMIHNKLPLQERLFRIQLSPDPYCSVCPSAIIQNVSHYFINCDRVQQYWIWVKRLCIKILEVDDVDDEALLKFYWPGSKRERGVSWLISQYIFILWDMLAKRKLHQVNAGEFFGFLRFKYKEALALQTVSVLSDLR